MRRGVRGVFRPGPHPSLSQPWPHSSSKNRPACHPQRQKAVAPTVAGTLLCQPLSAYPELCPHPTPASLSSLLPDRGGRHLLSAGTQNTTTGDYLLAEWHRCAFYVLHKAQHMEGRHKKGSVICLR